MRKGWPRLSKPPIGTPLDCGSFLTNGLVFFTPCWEGGGSKVCDLITGTNLTLESTTAWGPSGSPWLGCGLNCNGSGFGAANTSVPKSSWAVTNISIVVGIRWNGSTPSAPAPIFGLVGTSSTQPSYQLRFNGTSSQMIVEYNAGGSASSVLGSLTANVDSIIVLTSTGTTTNPYINGVAQSQITASASSNWVSGSQICIGQVSGGTARTVNATITFAAVYNRVLAAGEIAVWSYNPWGIFSGPLPLTSLAQFSKIQLSRVPLVRETTNSGMRIWAD